MNLTKTFVGYDELHFRVDLHRTVTYIVMAVAAAWWSVARHYTTSVLWKYFVVSFVLLFVVRWSMSRLGASRISSLLTTLFLFALCWPLSGHQLGELALWTLAIMATVEYFKERTKFHAAAAGVLIGILAAGMGRKGELLLFTFLLAVVMRVGWHAVVERLNKKQFVLFGMKAVIAIALSVGVFLALKSYIWADFVRPNWISIPHINWLVWVVLGLVMARGLWATLLLQTKRSPLTRGLRLYFIVLGLTMVLITALLRHSGSDIFAPDFLNKLHAIGLDVYTVQLLVPAFYAGMLLLTAGIDRSLFQDTALARKLRSRL